MDQNFPEGVPRKIVIQGRAEACKRASTMITELINGEPGSAQAIIQRVCQEVRGPGPVGGRRQAVVGGEQDAMQAGGLGRAL